MKKVVLIIALSMLVAIIGIIVVKTATGGKQEKTNYSKEDEPGIMADEKTVFNSSILENEKLKDLSIIDGFNFMSQVPQFLNEEINLSNRVPLTLSSFNNLYSIEYMRRIGDSKVAVIYKLDFDGRTVYAITVFVFTGSGFSNEMPDQEMYDLWAYTGECYYYSAEGSPLKSETLEKGMSFEEFAGNFPGLEHVFMVCYDYERDFWEWRSKILTENGVLLIVFGFERTTESVAQSAIFDSRLIDIISLKSD